MTRIQHVSIPRPSGSDDATRRFYGELLGLNEITPPHTLTGVIWYLLGDVELHLFEQAAEDGQLERHLCLEVADVHATRAALEGAGVETSDTTAIPGRPRFFARDPFGNRLEFTTVEGDYQAQS